LSQLFGPTLRRMDLALRLRPGATHVGLRLPAACGCRSLLCVDACGRPGWAQSGRVKGDQTGSSCSITWRAWYSAACMARSEVA
jgi:hypothetical protein